MLIAGLIAIGVGHGDGDIWGNQGGGDSVAGLHDGRRDWISRWDRVVLEAEALADARLVPLAETVAFALPDVPRATPPEAAKDVGGNVGLEVVVSPIRLLPRTVAPDTYTRFFEGYFAAGGLDEEGIAAMIWCESSWRIDPGSYHLGLAQFDPGTWATVSAITGFADPYNPYHQGFNVAVWASMISPGTTAGWPSCW